MIILRFKFYLVADKLVFKMSGFKISYLIDFDCNFLHETQFNDWLLYLKLFENIYNFILILAEI